MRLPRGLTLAILLASSAGAAEEGPPARSEVRVDRQQVLFYSKEYLRHSQLLRGKGAPVIAAWGWRIFELPLDSARSTVVVPEDPRYRFSNGSCVLDVEGDGSQELVVGRYARENWKAHDILWYERPPGKPRWVEHLIGTIPSAEEMPHDMACLELGLPGGGRLTGVVVLIGRKDLYLFELPADPRGPWPRHAIGSFEKAPQSGMRVGDVDGDGRPDIVCGMFWIECPEDPRRGPWKFHRFGDWDSRDQWGGMVKHGLADFDGDGSPELAVDEAEKPGSRLAIFKRDPGRPTALWRAVAVDDGLYCPHTLEVADLDGDGRIDIVVGEMDAGGWHFPLNPRPRLLVYLNQGELRFRRVVLCEGWGLHEAKIAPEKVGGSTLLYGNNTTQPWFDGMTTHLSTWTIRVDR
jgi:hypothetical protein